MSLFHRREDRFELIAQTINPENGRLEDRKVLFAKTVENNRDRGFFDVYISENRMSFLVRTASYYDDLERTIEHLILFDKDFKQKINKTYSIRSLDLHGYSLAEANQVVEEFIIKSFLDNVNKLIIVTGKGIHSGNEKNPYISKDLSILKYSVPEFISNNQKLMRVIYDIQDAKIEDGGSGAFYIYLKKIKKK